MSIVANQEAVVFLYSGFLSGLPAVTLSDQVSHTYVNRFTTVTYAVSLLEGIAFSL